MLMVVFGENECVFLLALIFNRFGVRTLMMKNVSHVYYRKFSTNEAPISQTCYRASELFFFTMMIIMMACIWCSRTLASKSLTNNDILVYMTMIRRTKVFCPAGVEMDI